MPTSRFTSRSWVVWRGSARTDRLERPFWEEQVETLSGGRIKAEIHPFDRSGLPGQEMLQLMRLGVVPFGTALLALVSGDSQNSTRLTCRGLIQTWPHCAIQ